MSEDRGLWNAGSLPADRYMIWTISAASMLGMAHSSGPNAAGLTMTPGVASPTWSGAAAGSNGAQFDVLFPATDAAAPQGGAQPLPVPD